MGAGAHQHLPQGFGDAVGPSALEDFFDLSGGPPVRVALQRGGDALPGFDVAALQRRPDGGGGPELHWLVGIAVGPALVAGGPLRRRRWGAPVGCQRHLASSSIATATERQRCLTSSQSALASGSDSSSALKSEGCGSASRRTNWVAIHCRLGA